MKATLPLTPSQTVGPYFTIGLNSSNCEDGLGSPVTNEIISEGEPIILTGKVLDGEQNVVPDALLEIYQADSSGSCADSDFLGFARTHTGGDSDGSYLFKTIKPGAMGVRAAPCISVVIYMRGLLIQMYTRLYFSDETAANQEDALLSQINESRRGTLIAQRNEYDGVITYEFDINMQGENETVFFRV